MLDIIVLAGMKMTGKSKEEPGPGKGMSENGVKTKVVAVAKYFVLVIGVVSGLYGFIRFVDWRISSVINEEEYVRRIASQVRPYTIFDANGSVLADGGGISYLQQPPQIEAVSGVDYQIIVTPKTHLPYAPMIEAIDADCTPKILKNTTSTTFVPHKPNLKGLCGDVIYEGKRVRMMVVLLLQGLYINLDMT